MPAPVPIQIRYDQPGLMGGLAQAAGQGQYGLYKQNQALDIWKTQYQGYLQQMANDSALTRQQLAADNAQKQQEYGGYLQQQNLGQQLEAQQKATGLQDAFKQQQAELAQKNYEEKVRRDQATEDIKNRQLAQQAGKVSSTKGHSLEDLKLVPEGGGSGPEPAQLIQPTDENGLTNPTIQSPVGPQPKMVPAWHEKNRQFIDSYPGLNDDAKQSLNKLNDTDVSGENLRIAASQLARQEKIAPTVGMKDIQKAQSELSQMTAAAQQGVSGMRSWLRMRSSPSDFQERDRLQSASDADIQGEFTNRYQYNSNLADKQPVVNSSGKTPLGGNDPQLQQRVAPQQPQQQQQQPDLSQPISPEQAMNLPSGTSFIGLDGVRRVKH
jgi:hypothetical protein